MDCQKPTAEVDVLDGYIAYVDSREDQGSFGDRNAPYVYLHTQLVLAECFNITTTTVS